MTAHLDCLAAAARRGAAALHNRQSGHIRPRVLGILPQRGLLRASLRVW